MLNFWDAADKVTRQSRKEIHWPVIGVYVKFYSGKAVIEFPNFRLVLVYFGVSSDGIGWRNGYMMCLERGACLLGHGLNRVPTTNQGSGKTGLVEEGMYFKWQDFKIEMTKSHAKVSCQS